MSVKSARELVMAGLVPAFGVFAGSQPRNH
jgi:hypothetical protein